MKSISHRCHPILVAIVWRLTKETIDLPLGCLQGDVECVRVITKNRSSGDALTDESEVGRANSGVSGMSIQGYLTHKKTPTPLVPP